MSRKMLRRDWCFLNNGVCFSSLFRHFGNLLTTWIHMDFMRLHKSETSEDCETLDLKPTKPAWNVSIFYYCTYEFTHDELNWRVWWPRPSFFVSVCRNVCRNCTSWKWMARTSFHTTNIVTMFCLIIIVLVLKLEIAPW